MSQYPWLEKWRILWENRPIKYNKKRSYKLTVESICKSKAVYYVDNTVMVMFRNSWEVFKIQEKM